MITTLILLTLNTLLILPKLIPLHKVERASARKVNCFFTLKALLYNLNGY
ncbi:hypothetical protein AAZX31_02G122300 [Glycine max]